MTECMAEENEFYIDLISDALHLAYGEGQISIDDYRKCREFVENGFSEPMTMTERYLRYLEGMAEDYPLEASQSASKSLGEG